MKKLFFLLLCATSCTSVFANRLSGIIDSVVAEYNLDVGKIPEFKNQEDRDEQHKRALQVALAYYENNYHADALRKYIYANRINPDDPDSLFMIGTLLIGQKAYAPAVEIFTALDKLYPSDYRINNNLGWIYCSSDDPRFRDGRKAEEYASTALLYAPQDHHVWSTLAEARYIYGNYEGALRAARQAHLLLSSESEGDTTYVELVEKCQRAFTADEQLKKSMKNLK